MKIKNIFWGKWKVIRTIWPYPEGYGVYKKHRITGKITLLDSGLSKEQARQSANQLNNL